MIALHLHFRFHALFVSVLHTYKCMCHVPTAIMGITAEFCGIGAVSKRREGTRKFGAHGSGQGTGNGRMAETVGSAKAEYDAVMWAGRVSRLGSAVNVLLAIIQRSHQVEPQSRVFHHSGCLSVLARIRQSLDDDAQRENA
jgi:hypothetical protein